MKSKKVVLVLVLGLITATLGWTGWMLWHPRPKDDFSQKEISIKQADVPGAATVTYNDWSGFKFDHPDSLTVKEVELDNPSVYSSLEIYGSDAKKLTIRLADTQAADLTAWQKNFMQQNSVRKIDQTSLGDLPALSLRYGAPENRLTVAVDSGIIYQITSQTDNGFWDRTHEDLVSSWTFTNTVTSGQPAAPANTGEDETITLIEETVD